MMTMMKKIRVCWPYSNILVTLSFYLLVDQNGDLDFARYCY